MVVLTYVWIAGASINSMPSSEIYTAVQTGVLDAANTSAQSFVSFRIYEQVECYTAPGEHTLWLAPGEHTLWFMYEPVLMSKAAWERLDDAQRAALAAAAERGEAWFIEEARRDRFGLAGAAVARLQRQQRSASTMAYLAIAGRNFRLTTGLIGARLNSVSSNLEIPQMKHACKHLPWLVVVLASVFALGRGAVAQDIEEDCVWVDGECIEGYVFAANYMSVEELKKLIDAGSEDIVIVDTSAELIYEDERIPGAVNLPWVHQLALPVDLPRDKTLVLYCACVGEEDSLDMAQKLSFVGFINVEVLEGGWFRWLELGYPTVGKAVEGS